MSYFIDPDARTVEQFDISKFMEFTEGDYDPLGSYMLREVRKLRTVGFHVVRGIRVAPI